jgi:phosphatidylserine/phosphatidylglycerophosphate/cardiolipin synthase-like enzyme
MKSTSALILAWCMSGPALAASPVEIHYSPVENLERIDRDLIASAKQRIDMAAYTLTNHGVIEALRVAQTRGVQIRILIDPRQQHARDEFRGITATMHESTRNPWMHLKSYAIDGEVLRTGSANFSASGEKQQDNDLVVLRDKDSAAVFERRFEVMWGTARPYTGPPAPRTATLDIAAVGGHEPGCDIKGNVNRRGERLYHLATDPAYLKVNMNSATKRWFCSEAQAEEAGWRHVGPAR